MAEEKKDKGQTSTGTPREKSSKHNKKKSCRRAPCVPPDFPVLILHSVAAQVRRQWAKHSSYWQFICDQPGQRLTGHYIQGSASLS